MDTKLTMLQWYILDHFKDRAPQHPVDIEQAVEQRLGKLQSHSAFLEQLDQLVDKGLVDKQSRGDRRIKLFYQLSAKGREELRAQNVPA